MTQTSQDQVFDNELKQKKRQTLILCWTIIFVLLISAAAIYLVCIYAPPLIISSETTRITGPLKKDGRIDFWRHIEENYYSDLKIATDENGFRIFTRTFGNVYESANASREHIEQKYQKLGLDVNIPPTMKFPELPQKVIADYYAGLGKGDSAEIYELEKKLSRTWTLEDAPMLAEWIKTADEPLDALAEMIRKPAFICPAIMTKKSTLFSIQFLEVHSCSQIARVYRTRANYRIAKGDIDGAINDIITIYQLGRQLEKDANFVVYQLVGIAIEGIAAAIPINANPNHPATKEQLKRLLDAIDQLPPRADWNKVMEIERAVILDTTQIFFHDNDNYLKKLFTLIDVTTPPETNANMSRLYRLCLSLPCNQNIVFNRMNEMFDKQDSILASRASLFDKRLLTSGGRGKIISELIGSIFLCFGPAGKAKQRIECLNNMKHLTLALSIYKIEHGEYPKADWIEKIKPYLGDNFEKYLRCPASVNQDIGKTNYALILYDKVPEYKDALQLVELREPVPFDQAVITIEEALNYFSPDKTSRKTGSAHVAGMNISKQTGAINFTTPYENLSELKKLLEQETK
ncbi:MAG: hypothetical protein LBB88_12065 [Planctomycetaceae bacterium]|nr:hypothetical protein [Planctomycetaceae bacterium]